MYETHDGLRDLYEVSCKELDLLVSLAHSFEGCLGARLTGAGFGGCTINLVSKDRVDEFIDFLKAGYEKETGLQANIFRTQPSRGAALKSSSAYRPIPPVNSTPHAIDVLSLKKTFSSRQGFWKSTTKTTLAVDSISFHVEKGELFGLLGPNGAGKTTTVKMLSTLLLPTSGSISIFGKDALRDTNEIRKRIGFTFGGARGLYGRLTAAENLRYFAELYALPPELTRKRIPELLELVGLEKRADDRVETFSSGMQQRLHLARALLHDPELIFLDEPTVGIDPVGARELRATVKQLIGRGKTILLTTHYMAEADELCDRIAIIKKGHLVALDTPSSLKKQISEDSVIDIKINAEDLPALKDLLKRLGDQVVVSYSENNFVKGVNITTSQPGAVIELLAPMLSMNLIQNLEVRNQTMEDVYVAIIGGDDQ
jgi:ABC-2 type transport system ATP-binding protein